MWDILRDPMWQFIGAILAAAAIFISIALYLRQRRRKDLSYEIVSRTPLLSVSTRAQEIKKQLQILFNGKPVQQVHLIVIKIINSGNMPILSTDYERPVSLNLGEEAQILTAEVVETDPDSLRTSARIEGKSVVLTPSLLNEKDSITLKMLVSRFVNQITVDGRIVGVKNIRKSVKKRSSLIRVIIGEAVGLTGVFGLVLCIMGVLSIVAYWGFFLLNLLGLGIVMREASRT